MKRSLYGLAIFVALGLSSIADAATFSVAPNGGPDCNTGICDLQSALNAAAANGEDNLLNLAAGEYDAGPVTFNYIPTLPTGSLTLVGDPGGGTVIDGNGNQVMKIDTFVNGIPDASSDISISDVTFQNGLASNFGAGLGIFTNNASVHIERCQFLSNISEAQGVGLGGGGLFIIAQETGSVIVADSEFIENSSSTAGGGAFALSVGGNVSLEGNIFSGNTALESANGGGGGGAFALAVVGSVTIDRNIFLNNKAGLTGGGLLAQAIGGAGVSTNNIISGNEVFSDLSMPELSVGGGVLWVTGNSVSFINNTVTGNKITNGDGGGAAFAVFVPTAIANIHNNIVFDNTASGGLYCTGTCHDLLVLDNGGGFQFSQNIGATVNVSHNDYSDIFFQCDPNQGCLPHQNVDPVTNLHENPLLANPGNGDFHLLSGSPAIDGGSATAPDLPLVDIEGNPRNQGQAPDMGALESTVSPSTEHCANNLDDDGDGKIDCLDPDCSGAGACQGVTPPGSENCANNLDDDGDGFTDCGDPNCKGAVACLDAEDPPSSGSENCTNNVDDDGDGQIDCNDPDCGSVCGFDNNPSPTPNISLNGGCSMTGGGGSPAFFLCLFAPLLLAIRRIRRY